MESQKTCPQCGYHLMQAEIRCPRCYKLLLTPCNGNCSQCKQKGKCS